MPVGGYSCRNSAEIIAEILLAIEIGVGWGFQNDEEQS